ncbi:metal ABC transporter permease [Shewanella saliphila]|uniref:Metal ABC transporter permease n=1 Tax=Shewanella saliphila TaxID=2282698 RepID=A0ABQ2QBI2_9GAMM|nr:metal ABC transporter permease [Shewanella saliphila]MCL1103365.1 metal ABC transporter permease [Shewanella saliphila]GGP68928.1 metal ABC transporter permease [Shewanella saliphila]
MSLFWEHLVNHTFLQYAIVGGLLASLACGVVGSFVVARRATYVAGAIAHCVLGGMGAARYMQRVHDIEWMTPLLGATVAAVIAALIVAAVTASGRQREDTVLSAIWAIGMAVGISFITATPGYYEDLMSYLFGNILMIGTADLQHMAVLDAVIVILMLLFYDKFLVISFQPELAKLRGIRVRAYHTLLLILISLTVVLLTQVVGLVMVIALLTLPAATALHFAQRLWIAMLIATSLCFLFTVSGIALSYGPELPAGATVIQVAGGTYLLAIASKWLWKKLNKIDQRH